MKKYLHIALMLLCVFVVSSCKDDDDEAVAYGASDNGDIGLFDFDIRNRAGIGG